MNNRKKHKFPVAAIACIVLIVLAVIIGVNILNSKQHGKTPKIVSELLDLGGKYLLEMNYEQAIVQFKKIIEIEPMNVQAYLGSADAYLHLGKQQDAINLLTAGAEATGDDSLKAVLMGVEKSAIDGYIAIAEAYEAGNGHEKALEILQRLYKEMGDEIIKRKLDIFKANEIKFSDDLIQWIYQEFERLIRTYLRK